MSSYMINPRLPLYVTGSECAALVVLKRYSTPTLGLLSVAGMMPAGHKVSLTDENVSTIDWDRDCDVVGLTGGPAVTREAEKVSA